MINLIDEKERRSRLTLMFDDFDILRVLAAEDQTIQEFVTMVQEGDPEWEDHPLASFGQPFVCGIDLNNPLAKDIFRFYQDFHLSDTLKQWIYQKINQSLCEEQENEKVE